MTGETGAEMSELHDQPRGSSTVTTRVGVLLTAVAITLVFGPLTMRL